VLARRFGYLGSSLRCVGALASAQCLLICQWEASKSLGSSGFLSSCQSVTGVSSRGGRGFTVGMCQIACHCGHLADAEQGLLGTGTFHTIACAVACHCGQHCVWLDWVRHCVPVLQCGCTGGGGLPLGSQKLLQAVTAVHVRQCDSMVEWQCRQHCLTGLGIFC
jgi:hypothetical protein